MNIVNNLNNQQIKWSSTKYVSCQLVYNSIGDGRVLKKILNRSVFVVVMILQDDMTR